MSDLLRPWRIGGKYARKFADRWPATFINTRHGGTYQNRGGLIFDARLVDIRCGYAQDGRSMDKGCEYQDPNTCIPGCTPQTWPCVAADTQSSSNCAWGPNNLQQLLQQADHLNNYDGYSEIVLDPASVERNLPSSVLAVFYQESGGDDYRRESVEVHQRFLREYQFTPRDVPLLEYSMAGRPHFRCVQCH